MSSLWTNHKGVFCFRQGMNGVEMELG